MTENSAEELDLASLRPLLKLPQADRKPTSQAKRNRETGDGQGRLSRTWIFYTQITDHGYEHRDRAEATIKKAAKAIRFKDYELGFIECPRSDGRAVRPDDKIISAEAEPGKPFRVMPPDTVWKVEVHGSTRHFHLCWHRRDPRRSLDWKDFKTFALEHGAQGFVQWKDQEVKEKFSRRMDVAWPERRRRKRRKK